MAESLWDRSLRDVLSATASAAPTPGGGSVAPITGALGLALIVMALEVSAKKQQSAELTGAITQGKALLNAIAEHADRDAAVFQSYMDARALPKSDREQQTTRSTAIQAAVLHAANVPLSAAEACLAALRYADSIAALVQRNVISDLVAGADILFGSLQAVLRSVAINLPAIHDQAVRHSIAERASEIAAQAEPIYLRLRAVPAAD
jgi:formiminotetrahydrofolate cyclodeaminase